MIKPTIRDKPKFDFGIANLNKFLQYYSVDLVIKYNNNFDKDVDPFEINIFYNEIYLMGCNADYIAELLKEIIIRKVVK